MDEVIDQNALGNVCHTSVDNARHYVAKANRATCEAAQREIAQTRPTTSKTLGKMLAVRLRKLDRQTPLPAQLVGDCDGCGAHGVVLSVRAGEQWANCAACDAARVKREEGT